MKPSKKRSKNRRTKSPQIEPSPPIDPDPDPQQSTSQSQPSSSSFESRSVDLAWLSEAFSSLSVGQIESAYDEAGCDPFKAAGILGTHLEEEKEEVQDSPNSGSTVSEGSSQKKAKKARPRHVAVSCGMVSNVMGKGYSGSHSENNEIQKIKGEVELKYSAEEAEAFLCSMLGEESDLGMAVVRDILDECRGDVEKALESLLELSDSSYRPEIRERFVPSGKNSLDYSHLFRGMGCKSPPKNNTTSLQLGGRASSLTYLPPERESEFYFDRTNREEQQMGTRQARHNIEKNILEALFDQHEVRQIHTYAPAHMDWRSTVKKLQNVQDFEMHSKTMSPIDQKPKCSKVDGYHEFRTVAQQNWDLMKSYYQRAAVEYSKGNRSHASCLAEKGNYYRDLARQEDERASLEIFGARNQAIKNTVTIDLHGQHVKQAIGLLKRHLLLFACIPSVHYLRVITGCGERGVGKGMMKRSVKSLAVRENIALTEENSGTILLRIEGRTEYSFADHDSDEE